MRSDLFSRMEMATHGDLRLHWGEEGIRITRVSGRAVKNLTTAEARWMGTVLPMAAEVVDFLREDDA